MVRKGIILAGGTGTRLFPSTVVTSKQLLPVYDKPMIYYPLTTLIQAGIKDILIITNPHNVWAYTSLFEGHEDLGLNIQVTMQPKAAGLPQAFTIGEKFIGDDEVCLILGDNFYHGGGLPPEDHANNRATIVAYRVGNPSAYGVLELNESHQVTGIIEKPKEFVSEWAVTGLYYYPNDVVEVAHTLKPSARGELEISDVNQHYCDKRMLDVCYLPRDAVWLDAGTHDDLAGAAAYVKTIESRTGTKIGCYEEAAWRSGRADDNALLAAAKRVGGDYGEYLAGLI